MRDALRASKKLLKRVLRRFFKKEVLLRRVLRRRLERVSVGTEVLGRGVCVIEGA